MSIRRYCPLVILVWTLGAQAQTRDTAAIFGTVKDTQGAIIPAATVTLTSTSNGQKFEPSAVCTDSSGEYGLNLIPVGGYGLSVEHPAFKRYQLNGHRGPGQ